MKYFSPDFLKFFKDLAANNNRDWFQTNKSRYEESVKKPFEIFVGELIKSVQKDDKNINIKPSEAIFRINKDIRFSKDKTPYKLNTSAIIAPGGRKSMHSSGIYVELGPEKLAIGGGIYMPEKELLNDIRELIAKNPKEMMKVLADKKFTEMWGEMQGEKNKVLHADFKKAAEICPYIYNKQFYYWVELNPKEILSEDLLKTIMSYYKASKPVSNYLAKAIK